MGKIRLGIIGCGGRQRAHIDSLLKMDDVEIVAVADPLEERRNQVAKQTAAKGIYVDHNDLFDNMAKDSLDALFISVEPTAHINMEERAIALGIPFMIEKPMTIDLKQAEELAREIEKKGLITSVGFQDRYLDLIDMIKEEIPKHKMGGLVSGSWVGGIPGVWWWQKKSTCGGQLLEQNIHLVDGLRWLFGEPLSVYAVNARGIVEAGVDASSDYDTDDYSLCVFRFGNKITASLASGCYVKGVDPAKGLLITLSDIIMDYRLRSNLIITSKGQSTDIRASNNQTYDLDRAFIDALKTGDTSGIRSPYSDALKTLKLCFAANRSMETGEPVHFEGVQE